MSEKAAGPTCWVMLMGFDTDRNEHRTGVRHAAGFPHVVRSCRDRKRPISSPETMYHIAERQMG